VELYCDASVGQIQRAYNRLVFKAVLAAVITGCVLLYAGDYASLRYRAAKNRNAFGSVEVQPYYAVPLKDGKTEFMFLKPQNEVCVHSMFPHLGHSPCWYANKHRDKRINM
jgi:hypothetical protein